MTKNKESDTQAILTLQVTWIKFGIACVGVLGLALGGGATGSAWGAGAIAKEVKKNGSALQRIVDLHGVNHPHGRLVEEMSALKLEFSSGMAQHFALKERVRVVEDAAKERTINMTKMVNDIGEIKGDMRSVLRTLEKRGAR